MGRVLLLALASFTPSVDAGLPYSWYLSRGLLLRGCDAESTRPAALRSGTPFYLLVLPDVSSDAADCEATECSQEQFDQFPGCSRCATRPPEQWRSPECAIAVPVRALQAIGGCGHADCFVQSDPSTVFCDAQPVVFCQAFGACSCVRPPEQFDV